MAQAKDDHSQLMALVAQTSLKPKGRGEIQNKTLTGTHSKLQAMKRLTAFSLWVTQIGRVIGLMM